VTTFAVRVGELVAHCSVSDGLMAAAHRPSPDAIIAGEESLQRALGQAARAPLTFEVAVHVQLDCRVDLVFPGGSKVGVCD
jgi:hypothetical protein